MSLLAALCAGLYVLGGMLARAFCLMHVETEAGRRSPFREPAALWPTVILWPWFAFFLTFCGAEGDQCETP